MTDIQNESYLMIGLEYQQEIQLIFASLLFQIIVLLEKDDAE